MSTLPSTWRDSSNRDSGDRRNGTTRLLRSFTSMGKGTGGLRIFSTVNGLWRKLSKTSSVQ